VLRQCNLVRMKIHSVAWKCGVQACSPLQGSVTFHRISRHVESFVSRSRNEAALPTTFFIYILFFCQKESERESIHSLTPFALNEGACASMSCGGKYRGCARKAESATAYYTQANGRFFRCCGQSTVYCCVL
jgi:hypothetical protein